MNVRRLLGAIVPVAAGAGIGGYGARSAPETYAGLHKPSWAPPASAFAPVWTTLHVGIAAAGYRLADDRRAWRLHVLQLALNAAWPNAFFAGRDKRTSLAVIGALDAVVAAEIVRATKLDRPAAALLVPYLAWSAFATALNASVSEPDQGR